MAAHPIEDVERRRFVEGVLARAGRGCEGGLWLTA